ncbi:unannotated protein [freshwater metagenome]|uniref:Unannotated protein n=1 Tax=freshwater metagenome TaxID=449393 RepID=A0A6J6KU65_9ZZZZ
MRIPLHGSEIFERERIPRNRDAVSVDGNEMERNEGIGGAGKWVTPRAWIRSWFRWVGNGNALNRRMICALHGKSTAVWRPPKASLTVHFFCSHKLGNSPSDIGRFFRR